MKLEQNVLDVDRCPKCHDDDLLFKYWAADDEYEEACKAALKLGVSAPQKGTQRPIEELLERIERLEDDKVAKDKINVLALLDAVEPEHIHVNCGKCGYAWDVACADAVSLEERDKPAPPHD